MNHPDTPIGRLKARRNLTHEQVAELLGMKPQYAKKLAVGILPHCGPAMALQIEERSEGEIRAEEMVSDELREILGKLRSRPDADPKGAS